MRGGHLTGKFTYYYEFQVDGKTYKNPSFDENYRLGNTIKIIYSVKYPFINKPLDKNKARKNLALFIPLFL